MAGRSRSTREPGEFTEIRIILPRAMSPTGVILTANGRFWHLAIERAGFSIQVQWCKGGGISILLILVVDDEPDVEVLFRQQFRHDLRAGRFAMKFAPSARIALQHIADAAGDQSF